MGRRAILKTESLRRDYTPRGYACPNFALSPYAVLTAGGMLAASGAANAQSEDEINRRQEYQQNRIEQGVRRGQITRSEAARLEQGGRAIDYAQRRAAADGRVTSDGWGRGGDNRGRWGDRGRDRRDWGRDHNNGSWPRGGTTTPTTGSSAVGQQHRPSHLGQLGRPDPSGQRHAAHVGSDPQLRNGQHRRPQQRRSQLRRRRWSSLNEFSSRKRVVRSAGGFARSRRFPLVSSPGARDRPNRPCAARASGSCRSDCAAAPR
ncbi:hypothetical protein BH10PSE6_BH10PSE6_39120 [soil metagenome]